MLGVAPADEERGQAARQLAGCHAPPEQRPGGIGPQPVDHVAGVVAAAAGPGDGRGDIVAGQRPSHQAAVADAVQPEGAGNGWVRLLGVGGDDLQVRLGTEREQRVVGTPPGMPAPGLGLGRSVPKMCAQSTSPGASWLAAVCPRSETPCAPRIPKPRSVKLSPLRTVRPRPSYGTQRTWDTSTPPVSMRSSTRRPTGLSASAVTMAVRRPKHLRRPRATLYSPPPSQTRNSRAVLTRMSPGSRRSITSPSDT